MTIVPGDTMAQAHIFHPQRDENGQPLTLASPSVSTALSTWLTPSSDAALSVTDAGELPASLYNVAFSRRPQTPASVADWKKLNDRIQCEEPDYPETHGLFLTSGCVILEPDDRVWLVHPSNAFAGIKTTFPKGRLEPGLTLAVNAVKETFEESGLWVEPVAWLADIRRTKSITRYYIARRTAGTPRDAGWESQAVSLVPLSGLSAKLNMPNDRKVLPFLYTWLIRHGTLPV